MQRNVARRLSKPTLVIIPLILIAVILSCHRGNSPPLHFAKLKLLVRHPLLLNGVVVVLDPGHGGADSGAVCHGVYEAALTYRTAAELAYDIRQNGGQVFYTVHSRALSTAVIRNEPFPQWPKDAVLAANGLRLTERDSPRPLWLRAAIARQQWQRAMETHSSKFIRHSLFFLSVHYDDFPDEGVHGSLICVDRRTNHVPIFAQILARNLSNSGLTRHDTWQGYRGMDGRYLGVLDPEYNPIPERCLLEMSTISNLSDARNAMTIFWRKRMELKIIDALIQAHRAVQ